MRTHPEEVNVQSEEKKKLISDQCAVSDMCSNMWKEHVFAYMPPTKAKQNTPVKMSR